MKLIVNKTQIPFLRIFSVIFIALFILIKPHQAYAHIQGIVFVDTNGNGKQQPQELGYPNATIKAVGSGFQYTITSGSDGTFNDYDPAYGVQYVVTLTVPSGYKATTPTNYTCTIPSQGIPCTGSFGTYMYFGIQLASKQPPPPPPTSTPPPPPVGKSIVNLNFGITNTHPWLQSTCGDIRNDNGIADLLPAGQFALITDATCTTPGVAFTGDTDGNYGQALYLQQDKLQEEHPILKSILLPSPLQTSYASLLAKAQNASITPTNLATVCTLSNCTLPNNLSHGIYLANSDVTLNTANKLKNNSNYIFLINGNLTLNGTITVPNGSTALFSTTKNIIVAPAVGSAANSTASSLDGWYIAGQNFIVNSAGNCNDLRLNVAGSVAVNALANGGTFQNNRDLCGNDPTDPTVSFSQRLDMILNAPPFLAKQQSISQEIAP